MGNHEKLMMTCIRWKTMNYSPLAARHVDDFRTGNEGFLNLYMMSNPELLR